jgi:CubicO group peptidase (beta-lactamase class C family)
MKNIRSLRFNALIWPTVFLAACASQPRVRSPQAVVERNEKVLSVENGLLPPVLIKGQTIKVMNLQDRMNYYHVPGVSVAVIENSSIEWARGYGVVQNGSHLQVTPETRFQAASISKPVTALATLTLVQNGALNLDEPVNNKLKSWKIPDTDLTQKRSVTLRQILSHSAGFNVHGFDGYEKNKDSIPNLQQILDGMAPSNSEAVRVIYQPGKVFQYSGGGFEVLEQLLTDVSNQAFDDFMNKTVLLPLEMRSSTFDLKVSENSPGEFATGHNSKGESIAGQWHMYPESAAAGLWTTPSDLAKVLIEIQRALKNQSKTGLSQKLAATMISPQIEDRGLGVIVRHKNKEKYFLHSGSNKGFKALFVAFAETGRGAVIMTNGDQGGGDKLAGEIMRSIAKTYGWPNYLVERATIPESLESYRKIYPRYVGQYRLDTETQLSISMRDGHLFVQMNDDEPIKLYPESDSEFTFLERPTEVVFPRRSSKGKGLIWRQSGLDIFAPRL